MIGLIVSTLGFLVRGDFLGAARNVIDDGLMRAKILGLLRDMSKTAGGIVSAWAITYLLKHGFSNTEATYYGLALGGMVGAPIIWFGSVGLSWIDKTKVNVQLQASAQLGKVVSVPGIIKPANVNEVIAAAKAGNF